MKTVIVVGHDGYIGWPLTLRLLNLGYNVVGIDNLSRRENVKKMNSFSATPIKGMVERGKILTEKGNFEWNNNDIATSPDIVHEIFKSYKPDIVVNLAQQPSAPFSHRSHEDASWTTTNNLIGTLNVLYAMKEHTPDAHYISIGSMGEYQIDIGTDIAEGVFEFEYNDKKSKPSIFPRRPGSIYHASKVASTYYIDCACRFWGLRATDIMQGVVYGNYTPEIERWKLHTRLDSCECFGTVINRFIIQAIIRHPLTIYGKGLHKRGFLALNDSIQCLMIAINNPPKEGQYQTWNQLDEVFSMDEVADKVIASFKKSRYIVEKMYMESPRAECVDDHYYNPITDKLTALGFRQTCTIESEVEYLIEILMPYREKLKKLKDVVIPKITWK